jgi:hypothetical protein
MNRFIIRDSGYRPYMAEGERGEHTVFSLSNRLAPPDATSVIIPDDRARYSRAERVSAIIWDNGNLELKHMKGDGRTNEFAVYHHLIVSLGAAELPDSHMTSDSDEAFVELDRLARYYAERWLGERLPSKSAEAAVRRRASRKTAAILRQTHENGVMIGEFPLLSRSLYETAERIAVDQNYVDRMV